MSMFPGAGAQVYCNEAGEPLGWDYPSQDEADYRPDELARADALCEDLHEDAYDVGHEAGTEGTEPDASYGAEVVASFEFHGRRCLADADSLQGAYDDGYADGARSDDDEDDDMDPVAADAQVLAMAGWGTDEDYGYFEEADD
jgi:hypothetical protein